MLQKHKQYVLNKAHFTPVEHKLNLVSSI